jgi:hypothetical protein
MFEEFMRDTITLKKQDGRIFENIKAQVDAKKIFINNVDMPVEEGDYFCRTLPNGVEETYEVVQAHYNNKFHEIPAHYQIEVRKTTRQEYESFKTINNYNVYGNGKININSTDNSTNTYGNELELFQAIKEVIKTELNDDQELINKVSQMETNVGKNSFAAKYNDFIQSIANHITIFVPFIPALTKLLTK